MAFYVLAGENEPSRFGGEGCAEKVYEDKLFKLNVNAKSISSFACSRNATFFLFSKNEEVKAMDPENPESKGLLHFY